MKISIKYISIVLLASSLFSCNVLEQEPHQDITPGVAFTNEAGANAAVNGMYSRMQEQG